MLYYVVIICSICIQISIQDWFVLYLDLLSAEWAVWFVYYLVKLVQEHAFHAVKVKNMILAALQLDHFWFWLESRQAYWTFFVSIFVLKISIFKIASQLESQKSVSKLSVSHLISKEVPVEELCVGSSFVEENDCWDQWTQHKSYQKDKWND